MPIWVTRLRHVDLLDRVNGTGTLVGAVWRLLDVRPSISINVIIRSVSRVWGPAPYRRVLELVVYTHKISSFR
jgi:hypothetical protein